MHLHASKEAESKLGAHSLRLTEDRSSPLVFFVHGRAGTHASMWTFRRALPETYNIIAAQAPLDDVLGGKSWYGVDDNEDWRRDADQASEGLYKFLTSSISFYNLAPSKLICFGFSQGAGLLSLILQRHPNFLDGLALLAGFVIRLEELSEQPLASKTSIFAAHGSQDERISLQTAERGIDYLRSKGFKVEFHVDDVGHKVGAQAMRALKTWTASL